MVVWACERQETPTGPDSEKSKCIQATLCCIALNHTISPRIVCILLIYFANSVEGTLIQLSRDAVPPIQVVLHPCTAEEL